MRIEEDVLGVGSPLVGGDAVAGEAFFFALVLNLAQGRGEARERDLGDEDGLLAGGGVDGPEFAVLAGVVALDEGEAGAVGAPLEGFGRTAGNAAFGGDGFDGERGLSEQGGGEG